MFRNVCLLSIGILMSAPALSAESKTYGAGVTTGKKVTIAQLIADPEQYVDKLVQVEGVVSDVCPKRGCWMTITSENGTQTVRVKVDDGVIVFPLDAKGKRATAEGKFTYRKLNKEEAIEYLQHIAEEKREPFDPASVTEELTIYTIKGTGAVIN
jgi:hypothetical protein